MSPPPFENLVGDSTPPLPPPRPPCSWTPAAKASCKGWPIGVLANVAPNAKNGA